MDPKGEQVFLFCIGSMEIVPLAAISYNGPFQTEGLESYGLNESALPERLTTNGTIVLEHCDTWEYAGVAKAQVDVLKRSMTNINNWKGESCGVGAGGVTVRLSWLVLTLAIGLGSLLLLN